MLDWLFSAGQALSVIGLIYGAYLSLTHSLDIRGAAKRADHIDHVHDLKAA